MDGGGQSKLPRTKRIITVAETPPETTINKELAVVSLYDSRLIYRGDVSGKRYEWGRAGAVVMVLSEDVPPLLEKRIGNRSCCGARQGGNKVFELAQEEATCLL